MTTPSSPSTRRSEPRLFYYITQYKSQGHSIARIRKQLKDKGYTDRDVDEALADYDKTGDLHNENQLVKYLETHVRRGFTLQQLIDHMLAHNVDSHLVERAVLRMQMPKQKDDEQQTQETREEQDETDKERFLSAPGWHWVDATLLIALCLCAGLSLSSYPAMIATVFALAAGGLRFTVSSVRIPSLICLFGGAMLLIISVITPGALLPAILISIPGILYLTGKMSEQNADIAMRQT